MKRVKATNIRLTEYEREKLEEISRVTGLPFSACIRVLIAAFIRDFDKNRGEIRFPIPMDAAERIWEAIQEACDIPAYVTSLHKLEKFLDVMRKLEDEEG